MKHTAEVTTALAFMAENLANNKLFIEGVKQSRERGEIFLSIMAEALCGLYRFKGDQLAEFTERYIETIMAPWCYWS